MQTVLLTTEGTYPCYYGGVSLWCDQLIRYLQDYRFHVLGITHSPSQSLVWQLPENVSTCQTVALWDTEEPGEWDEPFSQTYRRKVQTTSDAIRSQFLPAFKKTLRTLFAPESDSVELAWSLFRLYEYFGEHDYAATMSSAEAWGTFLEACSGRFHREAITWQALDLGEATDCMRWLQRYFAVLAVRYPRVDIVHASHAGLPGIPGVVSKLGYGARYILSEHGVFLRELYLNLATSPYSPRRKHFLLALNRALVRLSYHMADAITAVCKFNTDWQQRLGADPGKVEIFPNGVNPDVFFPPSGHEFGRGREPTILTMARIFPLKGIDVLLKAAVLVRRECPRARFLIMGEVADEDYNQQCLDYYHEQHLEGTVEFGVTTEAAATYRQSHIFCLPSISEAMPFSAVEAMLSGCAIVASEVGGVGEVLANTGLLVRPNDENALANQLIWLLDPSEGPGRRAKLAEAALTRARRLYVLPQTITNFRELYDRVYQAKTRTSAADKGKLGMCASA